MWNKIQKIYIGSNLVRPEVPPLYTPTANTLMYMRFKGNYNDEMWNTLTLTWTAPTYWATSAWEKYSIWVSGTSLANTNISWFWWDCTVSCWINPTTESVWRTIFIYWDKGYSGAWYWLEMNTSRRLYVYRRWGSSYRIDTNQTISADTWTNIIMTHSDRNTVIYINGTQANSNTYNYDYNSKFSMWSMIWKFDEFIMENKTWTATEVSNYFSATKSYYWL